MNVLRIVSLLAWSWVGLGAHLDHNVETLKRQRECLNCDFRGAYLLREDLTKVKVAGSDFTQAILMKADASEADFSRATLSGANLYEANLTRANFSGADLSKAFLSWTILTETDFSGADLSGAELAWVFDIKSATCSTKTTLPPHLICHSGKISYP